MWKLDGACGSLNISDLSAKLNIAEPHRGLVVAAVSLAGRSSSVPENRILEVHFPVEPRAEDVQDSWVRGTDLVVAYAQRAGRQVSSEIYWRLVQACANAVGIELILSVQTDLWDATPTSGSSTRISSNDVNWLRDPAAAHSFTAVTQHTKVDRTAGQGVLVFRLADCPFSYVEMIHPADFSSATLEETGGQATVRWQLFPESLEKGVIRRARVRGLFVDRRDDLAIAAKCFREFSTSAPPLTT